MKTKVKHKHKFYLKSKGLGVGFYRECAECGKVAKITKYKIEL